VTGPVTVHVMSGLGNRMRALCGAAVLADRWGRRLEYRWPVGRGFEPRLDQLWTTPWTPVGPARALTRRLGGERHTERLEALDTTTSRPLYIRTKHALRLPAGFDDWGTALRRAAVVEEVARRVETTWAGLQAEPYVGVMVRAHALAHDKTKDASPIGWYVDRLRRIREEHPSIPFFVSTDDPSAVSLLADEFDDVRAQDDKGRYNSVEGVQAAVADLYLLASSAHIVGPYWSSFVTMAEKLAPGVGSENSRGLTGPSMPGPGALTRAADPLRPWERAG
jgi:hypothetical protein